MPPNSHDCGICTLAIAPRDGVAFLDGDQIAHVPCYITNPAGAPLKDPAARDFLSGVHVLIVEDNVDALELLKAAFEHSGAFVTTADNATLGMSLLREVVPHVIVSDISMPDDGLELVAEVLAFGRELGSKIPAIAITAAADPVDGLRRAGFAAYIAKPLDPFALTVVAEKLARNSFSALNLRPSVRRPAQVAAASSRGSSATSDRSMLSEPAARLLAELRALPRGQLCVACACHILDTDYDGALKTMHELIAKGSITRGLFQCSACQGVALVALLRPFAIRLPES